MARIRTIKPEFFRHSDLYEAEKESGLPLRIAFAGLWTAADREGRFKWKPRELKLDCLPHDDVDFSRVLDALAATGSITKYEVSGDAFGFIPNWKKHQVINQREAASVLPDPKTGAHVPAHACTLPPVHVPRGVNIPEPIRQTVLARDCYCVRCKSSDDLTIDHIFPRSIGGTHAITNLRTLCRGCNSSRPVAGQGLLDDLASDGLCMEDMERMCMHVQVQGEGKGREGEGKGKENIPPVAEATRGVNVKFEEFWKERPRRDGDDPRKPAEKKFNALVKTGVNPDVMITGAKLATVAAKERGIYGTKFVPQTVKWLNDQRFVDYAAAAFVEDQPVTGLFYAKDGSEQLDAWDSYTVQTTGKHLPRDRNQGWHVASEWPPGYEPESLRHHIEAPRLKSMGGLN